MERKLLWNGSHFEDLNGNMVLPIELALIRGSWACAADRKWGAASDKNLLNVLQRKIKMRRLVRHIDKAMGRDWLSGWLSTYEPSGLGIPCSVWGGPLYSHKDSKHPVQSSVKEVEDFASSTIYAKTNIAYWCFREIVWELGRHGVNACISYLNNLIEGIRAVDQSRPIVWSESGQPFGRTPRAWWNKRTVGAILREIGPKVDIIGADIYKRDPSSITKPDFLNLIEEPKPIAVTEMAWNPYKYVEAKIQSSSKTLKRFDRVGGRLIAESQRSYPTASSPRERVANFSEALMRFAEWDGIVLIGYHGAVSFYAHGSGVDGRIGYCPWGLIYDPVTNEWGDCKKIRSAVDAARDLWRTKAAGGS